MQHGADVIARGAESLLDAGEAGAVAHLGADTALEHQVMSPSRGSSAWPLASAKVTPEQLRSVLTTTPSSLAGWAITHLRPATGRCNALPRDRHRPLTLRRKA